jgi:hypothetical protein
MKYLRLFCKIMKQFFKKEKYFLYFQTGSRQRRRKRDQDDLDVFTPRIPLTPQLMLHLLSCVYYAVYKGCALPARLAIDAIHKRATFEILPDVLMATEAVRHAVDASGGTTSHDVESPCSSPTLSVMSALMAANGMVNGEHKAGASGVPVDITANLARPRGSVTQLIGEACHCHKQSSFFSHKNEVLHEELFIKTEYCIQQRKIILKKKIFLSPEHQSFYT